VHFDDIFGTKNIIVQQMLFAQKNPNLMRQLCKN